MPAGTLQIRQISGHAGSVPGAGVQRQEEVCKYIDVTTCIGCKACEVACVEWNDMPFQQTTFDNTYQTMPSTAWNFWNLIKFNEHQREDGTLQWLMRKDQCMHCEDPGCLRACPADGAIVQYTNGIVDFQQENCIGCQYCVAGCPFDIPKFNSLTKKVYKCTLCSDRVGQGLEPACIKACPTGCLKFGTKMDLRALADARARQLRDHSGFKNAGVYDPPSVRGTHVIYVLHDITKPELYGGLPSNPQIPVTFTLWKRAAKPVALLLSLLAAPVAFFHYVTAGPREPGPPPVGEGKALREDELLRHPAYTRVLHWGVAAFFLLALLTGFAIYTPWLYRWLTPLFGGGPTTRLLHPWFSIAFVVVFAFQILNWLEPMSWTPDDRRWIRRLGEYVANSEKQEPDYVDFFNAGQKVYFWTIVVSGALFLVSGIPMWFPKMFGRLTVSIGYVLHDIAALVMLVGLIVHVYEGTAAAPGTFHAMTRGTVARRWAWTHHPAWYRRATGRQAPREDDPNR